MKIKPIKTIYDYNQAQKYLESIFHNELTEEELLKQFANLIIDIYFDQPYEKENQQ